MRIKITEELLRELHYVQRKSTEIIGRETGYSGRMIRYRMAQFGMVPIGDALKIGRPSTSVTKFKPGITPANIWTPGTIPWNKGQTKKTHPGVASAASKRLGQLRPDIAGPLNPSWKGGVLSENMKVRNSTAYANWRTAVFERDNFTCQCCGQRGGRLEANHIKRFADYPALRLDIANGETLCRLCHRGGHSNYVNAAELFHAPPV